MKKKPPKTPKKALATVPAAKRPPKMTKKRIQGWDTQRWESDGAGTEWK